MKRPLDRLVEALAPRLAYLYIRLLRASMRFESYNAEVLECVREDHGEYIMVFWHSRWVMMRYAHPYEKLAVLASRHRDAEMLVRVLARLDVVMARGSSTRGGMAGMREMLRRVRDGYDLAITPDGPRGPRRRIKDGVLAAARFTGKPIVPVGFGASRARRLRSWDRTLVPFPFGRGVFVYGEPMLVPQDVDDDRLNRMRGELERSLDRVTDEADRAAGFPIEEPRPTVETT
ncbi:MAG: DUF374 domain-containing protein [Acidobacteria bacterium]|nr:DUF374 domain-containing protein [Acidobacteriota bacterium]NIM63806.1 DUF374 domain-containing protein [Acidobacteriota bacterium]NIO58469.1 DUF374 domain-containing protein [Acidobacteriota bacterium]NIQ29761.1 DUF374 domain-containing protein [Acidobacteriota bacterium]NIQ84214.1 DUF374 domain-containing protein [Acidobacteriota bacterium]